MLSNFFKNKNYKLAIAGILVMVGVGITFFSVPAKAALGSVAGIVSAVDFSQTKSLVEGGLAGAGVPKAEIDAIIGTCSIEIAEAKVTKVGVDNTDAMIACMEKTLDRDVIERFKEQVREELLAQADKTFKDAIAIGFKTSLRTFLQQFSHDVSTWIASGGKGQKPLFITEGWGAYLRNSADEALGTFIDEIDSEFGTNLCRPNFQVRIGMIRGLEQSMGRAPRKPKCNFTEIVSNWQTAVRNPQLMTEYTNFLQPGNNDISSFLMIQTGAFKNLEEKMTAKINEAAEDSGWKDVTDFAGKVLTPGTAVRHQFEKTSDEAIEPEKIFTGTVWDFIESFLNSLMAGLLQNLQSGLFASDSSNGSDSKFNLPNLHGLFRYEAAPYVEGRQGAKERFSTLVESQVRVGGSYNVLVKLTQCGDEIKTNPGPTDCVLDQNMSDAIRNRKLVKHLDKILDRPFAPDNNQVSEPRTSFTLRNVIIMRKYRIVPVGWEIAARYINQKSTDNAQSYTLRNVMDQFNVCNTAGQIDESHPFCGLIDPNWVLKAPELFCRREGFGEKNDAARSQDGTVQRAQYCADEQQCLEEDDAGNCLVYGYCAQERRSWDFTGKSCEALYNTCQTMTDRSGQADSYLANTLDYRNCNSQNAGCAWYSGVFNVVDGSWSHSSSTGYNLPVGVITGESVGINGQNRTVLEYHTASVRSDTSQLVMDQPCSASTCTTDNFCTFTPRSGSEKGFCAFSDGPFENTDYTGTCNIDQGATRCSLTTCTEDLNVFDNANGSFNSCNGWNAEGWNEGYNGENNKHFCDAGVLVLAATNNIESIVTTSAEIDVVPGKRYMFSFAYTASGLEEGDITVNLKGAEGPVAINVNNSGTLQTYEMDNYITAASGKISIEIVTRPGTSATARIDSFSLKPEAVSCAGKSVWLTTANTAESKPSLNTIRYFDRDVQSCDGKDAGCHQFIRTAAGLGSNLLVNPGFEVAEPGSDSQARGWSGATGVNSLRSTERADSGNSVRLDILTGLDKSSVYSYETNIPLRNQSRYALSASLNPTVDTEVTIKINEADTGTRQMVRANTWNDINRLITAGADIQAKPQIVVHGTTTDARIYLDSVQLEEVVYNATGPSGFGEYNPSIRSQGELAMLKKAPDHYQCYDADQNISNGTQWPQDIAQLNDLPIGGACSNYAQACLPSEVGCELYTPFNKIDPQVPGRLTQADYCPVEVRDGVEYGICDGYQVYRQEQTSFTIGRYTQFIADNQTNYCSAAHVGCDAFTNLDVVAAGGESTAYFSQVRACQKPAPDGRNYYTWEGSDTTGYQLKVYSLKVSNNGNAPCTVLRYNNVGLNVCANTVGDNPGTLTPQLKQDEAICNATEEKTNPDCRAFYDTIGAKHYRLLSRTIANVSECVPFRRNQTQSDLVQARADCDQTGGRWVENACIYDVVPSQGRQCPATAAGCREYTGNRGNNIRNVFSDSFEGEAGAGLWVGGTIGNDASYPGGTSLKNNGRQLSRKVQLTRNRAYQLSFWVKSDAGAVTLDSIRFQGSDKFVDMFALRATAPTDEISNPNPASGNRTQTDDVTIKSPSITVNGEWQRFDLGPVFVTWSGDDATQDTFEDTLVIDIPADANIYIDTVVLKETQQKVYAIENSWSTPVACDNRIDDPDGAKAITAGTCQTEKNTLGPTRCVPGEMIGCQAYTNRASQSVHVKSFDQICRPGAVGCEMLIDTHNSDSAFAEDFLVDDPDSKLIVPADNTVYLVNDRKYNCAATARGCTAYGLPTINAYDEIISYSNIYLKDQPDRYSTDICQVEELWCEEYTTGRSTVYFKDPRTKLCEYRTDVASTTVNGVEKVETFTSWFRKGTNDPCDTSEFQTIGRNSQVKQPIGWYDNVSGNTDDKYLGWAGVCPAVANSCTEFIDPLAQNYNEVYSTKYNAGVWTPALDDVQLRAFTLYTLSAKVASDGEVNVRVLCAAGASKIWSPDASMIGGVLKVNAKAGDNVSGRFYMSASSPGGCTIEATSGSIESISIARTGVYYSLANSVDRTSCNGVVDYNEGCVPVNDRGAISYSQGDQIKRNQDYLSIDVDATYATQMSDPDQRPVAPAIPAVNLPGQRNANSIIKGTPDRVCDAWLYCTTYEKSSQGDDSRIKSLYGNYDRCLDIGLCTAFNDKRECANLITGATGDDREDNTYDKTDAYRSGYSLVGRTDLSVQSYYPVSEMKQKGGSANIVNGNFESVFGQNEPVGWKVDTEQSLGEVVTQFNIIGKPKTRPNTSWSSDRFSVVTDVKQAREGARYLKLNSYFVAKSEEIDVEPNTEYTISGWINTLDLKTTDKQPIVAEVLITEDKSDGGTDEDILGDPSQITKQSSGLGWQYFKREFTPTTGSIVVRLENYVSGAVKDACRNVSDEDNTTSPCPIAGFSLYDNIEIKPVLQMAKDTTTSRSCRMYPAQNALSCQYSDGNNNFYGQYGYCLTTDPLNPKQCLQWLPIDQLAGELSSELTGYSGRRPLYYCIEKNRENISLATAGLSANMGRNFWDSADNITKVVDFSNDVSVLQFPIPLDYRALARWPYIQRLDFSGIYLALGKDMAVWPLPMHSRMYIDKTCPSFLGILAAISDENLGCYKEEVDAEVNINSQECTNLLGEPVDCTNTFGGNGWLRGKITDFFSGINDKLDRPFEFISARDSWGGWGMIGFGMKDFNFPIAIPVPWHTAAESKLFSLMDSFLGEFIKNLGGTGRFGMKIITDQDSAYKGAVNDPVPGLPGDILGVAQFLDTSGDFAAGGVTGGVTGYLSVEYCSEMVEVVTSAGANKAWLERTNRGSSYVSPDRDCAVYPDADKLFGKLYNLLDDPDNEGDDLNPADSADVKYNGFKPGRWNYTIDTNPAEPDTSGATTDKLCAVQEKSDYTIIGYNYQTDYPPFGAIVQPGNSQYPDGWDSKDAQGIQPLYSEIRNPDIAGAGQPRMGQLHSIADLKGLFAKVYSVWRWDESEKSYVASNDIVKPWTMTGSDAGKWDVPDPKILTEQCADNTRPKGAGQHDNSPTGGIYSDDLIERNDFCYVNPEITSVRFTPQVIKRYGPAELNFRAIVDPNQLPIKSYKIDWGDGEVTTMSGLALRDRANDANPFVLYHFYDYNKMVGSDKCDANSTLCNATVNITVTDNWGAASTSQGQISILNSDAY